MFNVQLCLCVQIAGPFLLFKELALLVWDGELDRAREDKCRTCKWENAGDWAARNAYNHGIVHSNALLPLNF